MQATSKSEAAVDDILRRYDGKEGELLAKIRLKYGNAAWLAGAGQRSQAVMPGSTTAAGGCTASGGGATKAPPGLAPEPSATSTVAAGEAAGDATGAHAT